MPEFPYDRLSRSPDVEAPNLQAHDATDPLLVERGIELAAERGLTGSQLAVIGDGYGAITLALLDAGFDGVRVHQDLATGRRALARNALALGLAGFVPHELDDALLTGVRLVLLQLPKALAELEEIADAVARWAADDVVLVAGGRVKHMTLAQNEVLAGSFAQVQPQRAQRKSRLIVAAHPRPVPEHPPYPVRHEHPDFGLALVAHGGAFAGARIDIGTRVLLDVLAERSPQETSGTRNRTVVDLGCGTGALAAAWALAHPDDRVIATDRSAAAAASARKTMNANGLGDRVAVVHDDAASEIPDATADVVLLNPPFHLGTSVHTAAASRLFEAAARILRPGGELWTVYNSSLGYRGELTRLIGPSRQVRRTPKFTVTRSVRR
ncbi:class I SAM-dependent methyltransferase [Microbacterium sp. CIAB417]|uniref:class I SAM-dependent methyltransferase n=1 Tax=Microbacterium sp. CIAB417 TaxID=2860287 RepID=UPI001FABE16C|nr:methyltransferase [Microbacterium sp. CIAB417]